MDAAELKADLNTKIDELRKWLAAKPDGWEKRATPGQLQQWEDRKREEAHLVVRLNLLGG